MKFKCVKSDVYPNNQFKKGRKLIRMYTHHASYIYFIGLPTLPTLAVFS